MTYASDYDKLMLLMKRASKNHSQRTWNSIGTKQDALIKKAKFILKLGKVKDTGKGWKWLTYRAYGISKRLGV
jgi:hypothetical protein